MTGPQHMTWENFRSTVLLRGQQRVHLVYESPRIEVFGDGIRNRVGVWIEAPAEEIPADLTKLTSIKTRFVERDGRSFLEIATTTESLLRQFYHFAVAVAERIIVDGRSPIDAATVEINCFLELLEETPLLGIERQIGLLGELLFLERLIAAGGEQSLDAWLGPTGEPHDFRVRQHEFEVKTTVSPRRVHTIHGTEQLVPSAGCSLYLVSVLLGPPGAGEGFSLSAKVAYLSEKLSSSAARLVQFTAALRASGFHSADSGLYNRRFVMRRPMGIIPIDDGFPAITRQTVTRALGTLAPRIDALQYDVSVEGLESLDGTGEFAAAVES